MAPANNAQKIQDPEKAAQSGAASGALLQSQILNLQQENKAKSNNMKKLQHFGFSLLLLALLAVTFVAASKNSPRHAPAMSAEERLKFQELLNTIEPASLHEILHKHLKDKYQHGVYQEDKAAIEVVAQSNKDVARSLMDLARRQAPNTTTTIVEDVTTTTTALTTESNPPPTTPAVAAPTTTAVVIATPPPDTTPTTAENDNTTPNQQPGTTTQQNEVPTTTAETDTTTTAENPGNTPKTTATGTGNGAAGGTATATLLSTATATATKTTNSKTTSGSSPNDQSSSASSESGSPPSSSVTQETIYTTTRQDGSVATVTSVTVVPAGQAEHTGTAGATKTNGNPSLQSNRANPMSGGWSGVVGMLGVVVVGVL